MSIKTNFEFPRGEDVGDAKKQGQRLSQDLSKNFKAILREINTFKDDAATAAAAAAAAALNPYGLNGIEFSQSYTISSSGLVTSQTFTFTHAFQKVPTGFLITDFVSTATVNITITPLTRVSWTTTQISIKVEIVDSQLTFGSVSGTFKILVLR